ncbi:hypothetical protein, partial [Planococcus citreus]|uniref:hypothetical protein n=1 Tax=Planococcus citreus TaxID=1373 RepID=UPI0019D62182
FAAITRGCIVDVLLFSFQGSCCAPCFGDLITISFLKLDVNTISKYFYRLVSRTFTTIYRALEKIKRFSEKRFF